MIYPTDVEQVFFDCLFKEDELIDGKPIVEPVMVIGIKNTFGFHPNRLSGYKEQIQRFLSELPEEFESGWSFLNLCTTKAGEQWTGSHATCEKLMVLALGCELAGYSFPKDMWSVLPGGVPYITINKIA